MNKISLIRTALAALAALCLVAAVAACGSESTSTEERETGTATATGTATDTAQDTSPPGYANPPAAAPSAPADAAAATMTIADMSFGEPITVAPGAQITIKNDDSAEHSVTSQTAGQFDVHVDGNQQGTLTAPTAPGEYAIYCIYHPNMKGTLIVK